MLVHRAATLGNRTGRILLLSMAGVLMVGVLPVNCQKAKKYKPVNSNDVINRTQGGYSESQRAYLDIKQAILDEDYEKASDLARAQIDRQPMNLDAKVLYAEIMYKRYQMNPSDTAVKNKCIKMWLIIYRLIKSDGWTLSDKSRHTPFKYRFHTKERRDLVSVARLKELCGRPPKWRESNKKYLGKFLREEKSVKAKIVGAFKKESKTR